VSMRPRIVSIVLMFDSTTRRGGLMEVAKAHLGGILDTMTKAPGFPREWRAKAVTYLESPNNSATLIKDSPFVNNSQELTEQLCGIEAAADGQPARYLNGALRQVLNLLQAERIQVASERGPVGHRCVVWVFTHAKAEDCEITLEVVDSLHASKTHLLLVGSDDDSHEFLMSADRADWFRFAETDGPLTDHRAILKAFNTFPYHFVNRMSSETIPHEPL
jgi:hypothetical protein